MKKNRVSMAILAMIIAVSGSVMANVGSSQHLKDIDCFDEQGNRTTAPPECTGGTVSCNCYDINHVLLKKPMP